MCDLSGHTTEYYNGTWSRSELYAGGMRLATYIGGETAFVYSDWLGNHRTYADQTGAAFEPCTNLPFGDGMSCNSPQWDTELFTGDEHDAASNTEHTDFRQLATTQGRWLSPDPYDGSMDITNPQSLNRYAYVNNDPINFIDPFGLDDHKCSNQTGCHPAQGDDLAANCWTYAGPGMALPCSWGGGGATVDGIEVPSSLAGDSESNDQILCTTFSCSGRWVPLGEGSAKTLSLSTDCMTDISRSSPTGDVVFCPNSPFNGGIFQGQKILDQLTRQQGEQGTICGDFICYPDGRKVVGPPEQIGLSEDVNLEFGIAGAIVRTPVIWAGKYSTGGMGFNIKNFPFGGNRIGLDYHAWKATAGEMLLHLDIKIQQFGINIRHWRP